MHYRNIYNFFFMYETLRTCVVDFHIWILILTPPPLARQKHDTDDDRHFQCRLLTSGNSNNLISLKLVCTQRGVLDTAKPLAYRPHTQKSHPANFATLPLTISFIFQRILMTIFCIYSFFSFTSLRDAFLLKWVNTAARTSIEKSF